jgi:CheY-like chemotaxis protein
MDSFTKIDFSRARALIVGESRAGANLLKQVLGGLGTVAVVSAASFNDGLGHATREAFDLFFIAETDSSAGSSFVQTLRLEREAPNSFALIFLLLGQATPSAVARARDCGANAVLTKPLAPDAVLKRLRWVSAAKRDFIDAATYVGPDRRYKSAGPPPGTTGRRATDIADPLGAAQAPNLSQAEISTLIKPQRVQMI